MFLSRSTFSLVRCNITLLGSGERFLFQRWTFLYGSNPKDCNSIYCSQRCKKTFFFASIFCDTGAIPFWIVWHLCRRVFIVYYWCIICVLRHRCCKMMHSGVLRHRCCITGVLRHTIYRNIFGYKPPLTSPLRSKK